MMHSLKNTFHSLYKVIINILFPINCLGCQKKDTQLCSDCLLSSKKASETPEKYIYSLFSYKDTLIKKAIWKFKFEGKRVLAEPFSTILYDYLLVFQSEEEMIQNFTNPILLSIPSSKQHTTRRPYDQGELLCETLAGLDSDTSFSYKKNILTRKITSKPQTDISNKSERIKNIKGAFTVVPKNNEYIKNKNIILIDDVTTTGATLKEARRVLQQAGAKRIIAFTIAH